jgi:hypothetical protein
MRPFEFCEVTRYRSEEHQHHDRLAGVAVVADELIGAPARG